MPWKDPEKQRAYTALWKQNPEYKAKQKKYSKKYNDAHREERRVAALERYYANRTENLERMRKYKVEHPEKFLEYKEKKATRRKLVPREYVIENYLRDRVLGLDGLCIKFVDPGQRGAPDRLVVFSGMPTFYVELKRPHLGVLSKAQQLYHARLRARGQRVWVLWSKEDVDAFITEVTLT